MEAEDLQEDLTCSICLDYFEDPVSIECGHNFCRGCLHRSWAPGGGSFPCPECRQPSPLAALRPNWALARLTERMRLRRQGRVPPSQCDRHREALRLFCEDDQRPVCLVCRESREHQAHTMTPIDEAFYSYREKLLKAQCSLKDKMKKAIYFQDMEVKNATEWKEKMKNQRVRFSAEFAKLHRFLEEEEKLFLQSLSEEEEELKKKQNENTLKLHQKITSLKQLISEVREKSESPTLELLQETTFSSTFKEERHWNRLASYFWQEIASHEVPVTYPNNPKDVLTRSDSQDVNYSPEILTMKTVCQIPMMKEMLKRFQVAVSVVEDTAHPKLVFSQGGRYVKNGASASSWPLFSSAWSYVSGWRNSQNTQFVGRFQHLPCVLGKNIFTSGKHYWEVENRDSLEIAVGVCRGDVMGLADGSEMCPHVGIWALSWGSAGYRPLTSSPVSPTKQEPALQRVGVFLDSDAGDISFYSAVDGTHLHTFSCPLASRLRPFFWLSPLASLVIPAVTARK